MYLVETIPPPKMYALKVVENECFSEEMKIGVNLSQKCPYLVNFKEVFHADDQLCIVMEYCSGGDLSKRLQQGKPLSDSEIYGFLHNSAMAIKTLHDAGIIHRDIKPSNFYLIPSGGFKLGDYGTARMLAMETMTCLGSSGYIPPEIMEGSGKYTPKVDVFAWGITLMEIILGHSPFSPSAGAPVNLRQAALGIPFEAAMSHPHPVMALARRMISQDPTRRPTVDEVLASSVVTVSHIGPILAEGSLLKQSFDIAQNEKERVQKENLTLRNEIMQLENDRKIFESFFDMCKSLDSPCVLLSHHGKYLCPHRDGVVDQQPIASTWEQWTMNTLTLPPTLLKKTLRSAHGTYLSANADGSVCARACCGESEMWRVIHVDADRALKSGSYALDRKSVV